MIKEKGNNSQSHISLEDGDSVSKVEVEECVEMVRSLSNYFPEVQMSMQMFPFSCAEIFIPNMTSNSLYGTFPLMRKERPGVLIMGEEYDRGLSAYEIKMLGIKDPKPSTIHVTNPEIIQLCIGLSREDPEKKGEYDCSRFVTIFNKMVKSFITDTQGEIVDWEALTKEINVSLKSIYLQTLPHSFEDSLEEALRIDNDTHKVLALVDLAWESPESEAQRFNDLIKAINNYSRTISQKIKPYHENISRGAMIWYRNDDFDGKKKRYSGKNLKRQDDDR